MPEPTCAELQEWLEEVYIPWYDDLMASRPGDGGDDDSGGGGSEPPPPPR